MLNFFGNNSEVPNGYVYTSYTGSKYVFLEGLWFNDSSMKMVDPSKYSKMYASAQRQIVEQNLHSKMKIGNTYICEGKEYTFIGEGKFTQNGNVIAESLSISHSLMEAEDNQQIAPNGYVYTSNKGKSYYKKNGEWYISGTKAKVNSSASKPLEQAAIRKIEQENNSNELKIGKSTWTSSKGKEYTYVGGDRFISEDGKLLPKGMAEKAKDDIVSKKDDHREEDTKVRDDVDSKIDDTSTATPEDRHEEEKTDQQKAVDEIDVGREAHQEEKDDIKGLANKIKASPYSRKITVLLTRADKLSLMAADILLSGKVDEVKKILQSLNNRDE